jgi:hypothetical protein
MSAYAGGIEHSFSGQTLPGVHPLTFGSPGEYVHFGATDRIANKRASAGVCVFNAQDCHQTSIEEAVSALAQHPDRRAARRGTMQGSSAQ